MSRPLLERLLPSRLLPHGADPEERAGLRLVLLLTALLGALLVVLPLAVAVRRSWDPLVALDADVTGAAEDAVGGHGWLLTAARWVTHLGDPLPLTVLMVVEAVVLVRLGSRRLALFVACSRAGAVAISTTLKLVVDRARPVFDVPVAEAHGLSFPSGHALGAAAFWSATVIALLPLVRLPLRRVAVVVALAVPLLVAASRVLLGVHYLSDVVAGLVLGFGWTAVCVAVLQTWRREEGRRVADPLEEGVEPELGV